MKKKNDLYFMNWQEGDELSLNWKYPIIIQVFINAVIISIISVFDCLDNVTIITLFLLLCNLVYCVLWVIVMLYLEDSKFYCYDHVNDRIIWRQWDKEWDKENIYISSSAVVVRKLYHNKSFQQRQIMADVETAQIIKKQIEEIMQGNMTSINKKIIFNKEVKL